MSELTEASHAAAAEPDADPEPGQYLYFSSESHQGGLSAGEGLPERPAFDTVREVWLSASGEKAGYLDQRAPDGSDAVRTWLCDVPQGTKGTEPEKVEEPDLSVPPTGCGNNGPAYLTTVPTDPAAAKQWLYDNSKGGNPLDVQAFITLGDTIREHLIPNASLSALFKAAADIPGGHPLQERDGHGRPTRDRGRPDLQHRPPGTRLRRRDLQAPR
ncbi:hypothetical protein GCM10022221_13030 [Actinocorallia aurea]